MIDLSHPWRRAAILLVLAGTAAVPALAQDHGPVVASHGDARLQAADDDPEIDRPCVYLTFRGAVTSDCARRVTTTAPIDVVMRGAAGGAVAPDVARVEVQWRDGERTAVATVPNETYRGRLADRVRFFAVSRPGATVWLLRFFDAEGRLLAATQDRYAPEVRRRTFARGRLGPGGSWRATVRLVRELAPAPGAPDRTETVTCVQVRSIGWCAGGEPRLRPRFDGSVFTLRSGEEPGRIHQRYALLGVPGPEVTAVTLALGDGRRLRSRVVRVSGGGGTARVLWRLVPRDSAVQRLIVHGRGGRVLETHTVAIPPAVLGSDESEEFFEATRPPLGEAAYVAAGPVQDGEGVLRLREVGARMCADVDGADGPSECNLIPRDVEHSLLAGGRTASGRHVVGGIVPPDVAAVDLVARSSRAGAPATVRVATQAPAPYAGAFAPHVRTFVALLPVGAQVEARMLDAAGQELGALLTTTDPTVVNGPVSRPQKVLRSGALRVLRDRNVEDCLFVDDPLARLVLQTCHFGAPNRQAEVLVTCRPAASVVVVPFARATLETARGRPPRGHSLRLGGRRHTVFVVHAPDVPRRMRWRGGRATLPPLPSPRAQCGYDWEQPIG